MRTPQRRWRALLAAVITAPCLALLASACGSSSSPSAGPTATAGPGVTWMTGYTAPGTPSSLDKVGVIKVGSSSAKNVLVLEPGTSAGSAYFVPLAKWIVSRLGGWQVWSVERRENLLEDQSVLTRFKQGKSTPTELFDYYLGWLKNPAITSHFKPVATSSVEFAKQWGMNVAVEDLHRVVESARQLGGKVVLGGHSLGGSVVTAYATWDFSGRAGAADLSGLVYIDGASSSTPVSAEQATGELQALDAPAASPWLAFGGIAAPYAGVFNATGSAAALLDPNAPSLGQSSGLLPSSIVPPVPVTNAGQYGYALDVGSSPSSLKAAQAHLGAGLSSTGPLHGWDGSGALTPLSRYATMFSGAGMPDVDGTEWYFPQRLTDDTGAVGNGVANPAQQVLDVHSTLGSQLPRGLRIYAFGAALGGVSVPAAAQTLARQSGIPTSNLTLVDASGTYAHNDPAGAFPSNLFFEKLVPFLRSLAR